jgi:hypothetical protein
LNAAIRAALVGEGDGEVGLAGGFDAEPPGEDFAAHRAVRALLMRP